MNIFGRRPFFLLCVCGTVTVIGAFFLPGECKRILLFALLPVLAALLAVYFLQRKKSRGRGRGFLLLSGMTLVVLLALLSSFLFWNVYCAGAQAYVGESHTVSGIVTARRYSGGNMSGYQVRLYTVDETPISFHGVLDCDFTADLQVGYTFSCEVTFEKMEAFRDGYEEERDLLSRGIVCKMHAEDAESLQIRGEDGMTAGIFLSRLNASLSRRLYRLVGERQDGALAVALTLGNRSYLDDLTSFRFRRSGVSHLLALSGMHLSVVMGAVLFVLTKCGLPKRGRALCMLLLSIAYLSLTGFSMSACRATVMLGALYFSHFFRGERDTLTALGFSVFLILFCNPPAVLSMGFWLSVGATCGIVLLGGPVDRGVRRWMSRRLGQGKPAQLLCTLISAVSVSVIAMFSVLGLSFLWFGEVSLLAIPMTLLLSPLTAALLILGCLTLLLSWVPFVGSVLGWIGAQVARLMLLSVQTAADLPYGVFSLRYRGIGWVIGGALLCMVVLLVIRLRHRSLLFVPPVVCCLGVILMSIIGIRLAGKSTTVTYLHTSDTAEGVLLNCGTESVFCDLGEGSGALYRDAVYCAGQNGATALDAVVITSYHTRQPAYLQLLCGRIAVRRLWLPVPSSEKEWYLAVPLIERADGLGIPVSFYGNDTPMRVFGTGELTVSSASLHRSMRNTALLRYRNGHCGMTYVGSAAEESALAESVAQAVGESRLVIFGSYGPVQKMSFSYDFAECTNVVFANDKRAVYWDIAAEPLPQDLAIRLCPYVVDYRFSN